MTEDDHRTISLFSYGTLQDEPVQLAKFGRRLQGRPDSLVGYRLAPLEITDPEVVRLSGAAVHTIARRSGDPHDLIPGVVFSVTPAELDAADAYEVDAYGRTEATLASGARAFVYVGPDL
jgi:Gamma-glutamyl cyclotransferase, AIG2-like